MAFKKLKGLKSFQRDELSSDRASDSNEIL